MDMPTKLRTIRSFSFRWPILQRALALGEDSRNARFIFSRNFRTKVRKLVGINKDVKSVIDRILEEDSVLVDEYFADDKFGFDDLRKKMEKKLGIQSMPDEVSTEGQKLTTSSVAIEVEEVISPEEKTKFIILMAKIIKLYLGLGKGMPLIDYRLIKLVQSVEPSMDRIRIISFISYFQRTFKKYLPEE